jgi:hypothetical protein
LISFAKRLVKRCTSQGKSLLQTSTIPSLASVIIRRPDTDVTGFVGYATTTTGAANHERAKKYKIPLTINHQHNPDPDSSLPDMRTMRTATGKASNAAAKPPIPPQSAKAKAYTR